MDNKENKQGYVMFPWLIVSAPYVIVSDEKGTRKVWQIPFRKRIIYIIKNIIKNIFTKSKNL